MPGQLWWHWILIVNINQGLTWIWVNNIYPASAAIRKIHQMRSCLNWSSIWQRFELQTVNMFPNRRGYWWTYPRYYSMFSLWIRGKQFDPVYCSQFPETLGITDRLVEETMILQIIFQRVPLATVSGVVLAFGPHRSVYTDHRQGVWWAFTHKWRDIVKGTDPYSGCSSGHAMLSFKPDLPSEYLNRKILYLYCKSAKVLGSRQKTGLARWSFVTANRLIKKVH